MFTNYLKIAWRNIIRNKSFSAINILGLAAGLACSLLIMLWVQDERGVDAFHTNGDRLYQVYERSTFDGKTEGMYNTQGLLAQELKNVIPEVEYASGLESNGTATFEAGDRIGKMTGSFAGEDFFSMFTYPLLEGTAQTALNTPEAVAISRKMAEQFFGSAAKAVGRPIRFENKLNLTVTAVFENLPVNSTHQFDFVRSWKAFVQENAWVHNWSNTSPATYVQLRAGADAAKVSTKIKDFIYRYKGKQPEMVVELDLQPFRERYLHSAFENGTISGGRIEYVRMLSVVAVFILLIACINFMNLATARSAKRAKEVGVRKVVGAQRSALIGQFVGEALMLTFFAVLVSLFVVVCILPAFSQLTGKQLSLPVGQPFFWLALTGLMIVTGFVAGSYPAVFLSSLKPARVLKGSLKFGQGPAIFRKSLVVLQFTLTIVLLIGMIVMYRQMDYFRSRNLGYDRENLLYIPLEGNLLQQFDLFREEAGRLPGILSVSRMRNSPTVIGHHSNGIEWPGKPDGLAVSFADAVVGYDFVKTLNLQVKAGRDFSRAYGADSSGFLVNESAVKKMGLADPIGQPVTWGNRKGSIIGVLKDFHFNSMHQAIEPLIVRLDENFKWGTVLVRTAAGKTQEALTGLEKLSKTINPKFPFTYQFSDLEYNRLYKSEAVVSKLAGVFAFLAIFISCLGLFGLAMFTAEQRTKEIGVRKVMGASVPDIIRLLSKDFLKPVMIAMLIGFPLAWYTMYRWLQGFAYQTDMVWWVFGLAAFVTVSIATLTVSMQSLRAALTNPVKSLKAES